MIGSNPLPVLPLFPDNTLPPIVLLRQWLREAAEHGSELGVEYLPHGNGILPEILSLAHFKTLRIFREDLPRRFRWSSPNGAHIEVDNRVIEAEIDGQLPELSGHLPPSPGGVIQHRIVDRVLRRIEVARLADVNAALGGNMGADWRPALAALSYAGAPPPLRTKSFAPEDGPMRVWNPLPFPRRCVAALPPDGEAPPWAVIDQRGAQHPVQVVEGPIGEEWLIELQLGALEVVDLVPYDQPTNSDHWEVSDRVIDNGWVRAEFNQEGGITRCCFDGTFINIDEAIGQPLIDGRKPQVSPSIRPLESGPSRGRLLVTYNDPAGHLRITYTVHAHDDVLQVAVTWNPHRDAELVMEHPLLSAGNNIEACGDGCAQTIDLNVATNHQLERELRGIRWLKTGETEQAFALICQRPTTIIPRDLQVVIGDSCVYGLCCGKRSGPQLSLSEAAIAMSVPGRHAGYAEIAAPAFHLGNHHDLTAVWCARPEEWELEIMLVEQHGKCGQADVYPAEHLNAFEEARLVDVDGKKIKDIGLNKERDAWIVPFEAHDILILRLR